MHIICSDLEGVFVPEIWINVAEKTGIPELKKTTRDEPDYDKLMRGRLKILDERGLKLADIQEVIATMDPMPGAGRFLDWARRASQIIVVSDTFIQFAGPLMEKLGFPTLLCNTLEVDDSGRVTGYRLRQADGKRHVVRAVKSLNYRVVAMGDSYNDISMLKEADAGVLFRPPENVIREFPQFPVTHNYDELKAALIPALEGGA
ncbi:MAG: bifunctional phosphoserine phosphatase/homoserine phosphotransferase ThrH [Proteobacteria bacterium]|nr:bifunctional phosphoserine phosphatase/homoserine phosphotransferase ThrH [Pseudomonadota bacterium]